MYAHERSLVTRYKDKPFVLLGINSDQDRDALKKVLTDEKITWRSWWNGGSTGGPIAKAWGVSAWPTIYLIDAKGIVRHRLVGGQGLDQALTKLMKETDSEVAKKPAVKTSDETTAAKPQVASKATQDSDREERLAETKLKFARILLDDGKTERARERLQDIVRQYPNTDAAKEAKEALEKLK
jgi:thioredoxin-like negative regulator of GroEL